MADDIREMKEWLLANAQQSRHPEYGDKILAALDELEKLRAERKFWMDDPSPSFTAWLDQLHKYLDEKMMR